MTRSEECKGNASKCRWLSREARSGEEREQLLKMADAWERFAIEHERHERNGKQNSSAPRTRSMADNERETKPRTRTEGHVAALKQRDITVRELIEKERLASAAKTARLRALRLEKEAADKAREESAGQAKAKKPRASRLMKRAPGT